MQAKAGTVEALRRMIVHKGYVKIPSNGTSMFPLIRTGNICRFEPVLAEEIEAGDILLFVADSGMLVGHRFIRREIRDGETLYICRGDSRKNEDPPLKEAQILGKMVSIQKAGLTLWTNNLWLTIWGACVLRIPWIPASIDFYLRLKRKMRGMRRRLWAS